MFSCSAAFCRVSVQSRGRWFGLAHTGASELSYCVGGMMGGGCKRKEARERERGRMGA